MPPPIHEELYIGIMTGTSMDAIDVVIARFTGFPEIMSVYSEPLRPEVRSILLDLAVKNEVNMEQLVRMHFVLAKLYANAVHAALKIAKLQSKDIRAIGLHGQTIRHLPKSENVFEAFLATGATFQLGSGSALAALTGIDVVSDFRSGDIVLGGEGAPLVPMFDNAFIRSDETDRILLNIGGIANLTFLPVEKDENKILAFDTGPGNMILDELAQKLFGVAFDENGEIARSGKLDLTLLDKLLSDPYFPKSPPKSTGRELFGQPYISQIVNRVTDGSLTGRDAMRTALELTARSIANSIAFLPIGTNNGIRTELIVSGGGVRNAFLFQRIAELLPELRVLPADKIGIPSQAKEALAFAWFAKAFLLDERIHLPLTTGASRKIILGSLSKGS